MYEKAEKKLPKIDKQKKLHTYQSSATPPPPPPKIKYAIADICWFRWLIVCTTPPPHVKTSLLPV